MKQSPWLLAGLAVILLGALAGGGRAEAPDSEESQVQQGLAIAPVPLDLHGKNRALVGLGSYIINAHSECLDCHSCPTFAPGHNPFLGQPKPWVNATNYLAGGVHFGPFVSANITPDPNKQGRPAGLTFKEFRGLMRTGHDPDTGALLQVMPWPVFANMTDRDLRALYEFLRAIPHAEPGSCSGPGQ